MVRWYDDKDLRVQREFFDNPNKLRDCLNKKIIFEFETGARITGTLIAVEPKDEEGWVQLAILKDVQIISNKGRTLEKHEQFSLVPNKQSGFYIHLP